MAGLLEVDLDRYSCSELGTNNTILFIAGETLVYKSPEDWSGAS